MCRRRTCRLVSRAETGRSDNNTLITRFVLVDTTMLQGASSIDRGVNLSVCQARPESDVFRLFPCLLSFHLACEARSAGVPAEHYTSQASVSIHLSPCSCLSSHSDSFRPFLQEVERSLESAAALRQQRAVASVKSEAEATALKLQAAEAEIRWMREAMETTPVGLQDARRGEGLAAEERARTERAARLLEDEKRALTQQVRKAQAQVRVNIHPGRKGVTDMI